MTYSAKNDEEFTEKFIRHYGAENIPDPNQYPKRFEFLVKSFEHYNRMRDLKDEK